MEQIISYLVSLADYVDNFLGVLGQHLFLIFGLLAIVASVILVFAKSAVHSVLAFLACMLCTAACYLALQAQFLAVAQMLVYAGGIVVLFLFVVMLIELSKYTEKRIFQKQAPLASAVVLAGIGGFLWLFSQFIFGSSASVALTLNAELSEGLDVASQNAQAISRGMFTGFLLPFETMSVILLIALIGAVTLAKHERV
jgi:NADH-quinone oxidoreductase subunit J